MNNRTLLLQELLNFTMPLPLLEEGLSSFSWDSEETLAVLTQEHLLSILQRFLRTQLTAQEVETWANMIEGREDIDLQASDELSLSPILFELANPLLTHELTQERAGLLISTLQ